MRNERGEAENLMTDQCNVVLYVWIPFPMDTALRVDMYSGQSHLTFFCMASEHEELIVYELIVWDA